MKRLPLSALLARSSLLVAARLAGAGVTFAGNILIARWFGAETLGIVALSMAVVSLLALAMPVGRQAVGMLFVSEYLVQKRPDHIRGFIRAGYRSIAIMAALAIGAFAVLSPLAAAMAEQDQILAVAFACMMAPALAIINFNASILTGFRRPLLALTPDMLVKPCLIWVAVAALAFLAPAAKPYTLPAAICVALWITAGVQALVIRRRGLFPQASANLADETRWRRAARPWIAIILLSDNIVELHLLMAGVIMVPAEVAILHICFRLRMLASFAMRSLYTLLLPDIYAAYTRGETASVCHTLTRANALALVVAVGVSLGAGLLGDIVLGILGKEFLAGQATLLIVCLSMIPRALFGPATEITAAAGRQKPMILIMLSGTALSMVTGLVLFPVFGMNAIAAGYSVAIGAIAAAQWWWAKRMTGIDCSILSAFTHNRQAAPAAVPANGIGPGTP